MWKSKYPAWPTILFIFLFNKNESGSSRLCFDLQGTVQWMQKKLPLDAFGKACNQSEKQRIWRRQSDNQTRINKSIHSCMQWSRKAGEWLFLGVISSFAAISVVSHEAASAQLWLVQYRWEWLCMGDVPDLFDGREYSQSEWVWLVRLENTFFKMAFINEKKYTWTISQARVFFFSQRKI